MGNGASPNGRSYRAHPLPSRQLARCKANPKLVVDRKWLANVNKDEIDPCRKSTQSGRLVISARCSISFPSYLRMSTALGACGVRHFRAKSGVSAAHSSPGSRSFTPGATIYPLSSPAIIVSSSAEPPKRCATPSRVGKKSAVRKQARQSYGGKHARTSNVGDECRPHNL
jgi:hypothetical protein